MVVELLCPFQRTERLTGNDKHPKVYGVKTCRLWRTAVADETVQRSSALFPVCYSATEMLDKNKETGTILRIMVMHVVLRFLLSNFAPIPQMVSSGRNELLGIRFQRPDL